ncbi:DUF6401 family natural product biosynthesis protein [Actinocorallia populi]|uniref:DUF6401 family natural product biosynthesis protein n=1 Tax=Actinocorallia populi TaxID=2079200 RepID=UPI000D089FBC|nr:DUF6401 family natural product biosynthesis protein [Actinocorallia populi]
MPESSFLPLLSRAPWAPGLGAAADQHAAAVRDIIEASGLPVTRATLRDYLDGFLEALEETGWRLGSRLDWHAQRMLAVQRLIDQS